MTQSNPSTQELLQAYDNAAARASAKFKEASITKFAEKIRLETASYKEWTAKVLSLRSKAEKRLTEQGSDLRKVELEARHAFDQKLSAAQAALDIRVRKAQETLSTAGLVAFHHGAITPVLDSLLLLKHQVLTTCFQEQSAARDEYNAVRQAAELERQSIIGPAKTKAARAIALTEKRLEENLRRENLAHQERTLVATTDYDSAARLLVVELESSRLKRLQIWIHCTQQTDGADPSTAPKLTMQEGIEALNRIDS